MEKNILRDTLFQKYFEIENGILMKDFVDKLAFITKVWRDLHILCENNIKFFDSFSSLEKCKMITHMQKNYLIIKLEPWNYVIIDIDKMENVEFLETKNIFDEKFFINYFDEIEDTESFLCLFNVEKYDGNIQKLVNFYYENEGIFSLSTSISCKFELNNAWTCFYLDFPNQNAYMSFETSDGLLYEHLFFNYDLTPYGMQDAQQKMGRDKMKEFFRKINDAMLPIESIPNDLCQQYLIHCNNNDKKLTKNK